MQNTTRQLKSFCSGRQARRVEGGTHLSGLDCSVTISVCVHSHCAHAHTHTFDGEIFGQGVWIPEGLTQNSEIVSPLLTRESVD